MKRILIANRGEIALRIIRACRDEGYTSIAIASDADRTAKFTREADEVHHLSGDSLKDTYLNQVAILALAADANADAIHPGYGLLSENEAFAAAVEAAGMTWIGPPPEAIAALGDKVRARAIAEAVGAPLLPASTDGDLTLEAAKEFVSRHGMPVIIKAMNGGGGRGMRIVREAGELAPALEAARREAGLAFGRPECFIERYAQHARHVETQCLVDLFGTVRVLSTRDCTLQRRQQKLVEEAPAPFLSAEQEARLVDASTAILKAVKYRGAATCEFLLTQDGALSFLEVNTRVQVEHPVTEEVTGVDIIRAMFAIAEGEALPTEVPKPRGHAIEFRLNAEDPWADFQPSAGLITGLALPGGPGVRLDLGYDLGDAVPPFYDSLFGKLIVTGHDRTEALARARRALGEFAISGISSIAPLHRALLERPEFTASAAECFTVHTRWIDEQMDMLCAAASDLKTKPPALSLVPDDAGGPTSEAPTYRVGIQAPLSGVVAEWLVEVGDMLSPGDDVAIMEAMKMEQMVVAETSGVVACRNVDAGSFIEVGADLIGLD